MYDRSHISSVMMTLMRLIIYAYINQRKKFLIVDKKTCVVLLGSFDRSAVSLSNLKIILI